MGTPRRAASVIEGCGADRGHGDSAVCCIAPMWMLRGWRTQQGRGLVLRRRRGR